MTTFRKYIETRIADNKVALGVATIGDNYQLSQLLAGNKDSVDLPAVFVWREKKKAGINELLGSARQRVATRIVITVVTDNQAESPEDQAEIIGDAIWDLLAGWKPTSDSTELLSDEGNLVKVAAGLYCWNDYYVTKNWKQENR